MTARPTPPLEPYAPAALADARGGTWEYDVASDALRCDAAMAALYGLDTDEAARGVPIARFREAIHPEDLHRHFAQCREVFHHGGLFLIEYRTRPRVGEVRWVLVRGSYVANEHGIVVWGRGLVLDLTESKQDGYADGRVHFLSLPEPADEASLLDHVAVLVLQARRAIDRIGGRTMFLLRPAVDMLLHAIGRRIAARLGRPEDVIDEGVSSPDRPHRSH